MFRLGWLQNGIGTDLSVFITMAFGAHSPSVTGPRSSWLWSPKATAGRLDHLSDRKPAAASKGDRDACGFKEPDRGVSTGGEWQSGQSSALVGDLP